MIWWLGHLRIRVLPSRKREDGKGTGVGRVFFFFWWVADDANKEWDSAVRKAE